MGWYGPSIGEEGREADFVFFGNPQGLLITGIKDRPIDRIEEAEFYEFEVWLGGGKKSIQSVPIILLERAGKSPQWPVCPKTVWFDDLVLLSGIGILNN
jgi:hypothetical protein